MNTIIAPIFAFILAPVLVALAALPAAADAPVIKAVTAIQTSSGSSSGWQFQVTLSHPDTGWDHYADGWRVETAAGKVLGTRVLHHPHVSEQPFTRALGSVDLPQPTGEIHLRARCSVDGWSAETQVVSVK